ncbi:hypothetical protein [Mycoplasmopsis felifaucium]|uniref:hypothetical protein n=1 Tax=Mycoplasmopsis felifaucium TaxID=35768 RepID=UPI00146F9F13|nr:hypothetical protein [Mycoplasmopsis felifaucium]
MFAISPANVRNIPINEVQYILVLFSTLIVMITWIIKIGKLITIIIHENILINQIPSKEL